MFYDRYAGCVDGACMVRMAGGGEKRLAEIRKGDVIEGLDGSKAAVTCVVRTQAPDGKFLLVQLPHSNLRVTRFHPVCIDGEWRFPADLAPASELPCEAVYTLVLGGSASAFVVNGVSCVSLGHHIEEGAARHPFYGSERVLADLANFPSFQEGLVELLPGSVVRDPETGQVCGLVPPEAHQNMGKKDTSDRKNALYLSRAWCVFEQYVAFALAAPVTVIMPPTEQKLLQDTVSKGTQWSTRDRGRASNGELPEG
eukprot:gnl/TRDRNA2_/TRDRNA2_126195_c0_seq1.p1 gnl/TRDRNA2_/TRDRNA2_126195_c0~~gnl/TRDRNA2_/TRDRNA2_126195_c0_seq1.p1  ORF type:complete len:255 (+),score=38.96 gnl/TRDRNA2_/TRDRNA2_126195_c0_seq1:2-766(+)